MSVNILTNELPTSIDIDGLRIPISMDFRRCIQVSLLAEAPLERSVREVGAFNMLFGCINDLSKEFVRKNFQVMIERAMSLVRLDDLAQLTKAKRQSSVRTLDWDEDQKRLVADFQREYAIDLTDPNTKLHWWRFLALFEGLSDDSATMTAIRYRAMVIPVKMPAEEKQRLQEQKRRYRLPPRTREEVIAHDLSTWGDTDE